jgi:hypothetical protein
VLIPPEALIDGCMRTLLESVLPDVGSRFARGQLYAVADVLRNLRDRVEPKASLAEAESKSAADALAAAIAALSEAGAGEAAARLRSAAAAAPASAVARAAALESAVTLAFEALEAVPPAAGEAARRALVAHLVQQTLRDVAQLKPSLLNEISKG